MLLLTLLLTSQSRVRAVFAAQRYFDQLGNVYANGRSHLWSINSDGSSLLQLTSGDSDDTSPVLSLDGRHLLFWRTPSNSGNTYLFRMNLDGTGLQRLTHHDVAYTSTGIAHAIERFGESVLPRSKGGNAPVPFFDAGHRRIFANASADYSPDGIGAIVYPDNTSAFMVDLASGAKHKLAKSLGGFLWLAQNRALAIVGDPDTDHHLGKLAFLNGQGQITKTMAIHEADEEEILGNSLVRSGMGFQLTPNKFLWVAHRAMSDGGYDFTDVLDLQKKQVTGLVGGGTLDLNPGRTKALMEERHWIGGYKGVGAAKLSTLEIRDLRSGAIHALGFRLMDLNGACFAPFH